MREERAQSTALGYVLALGISAILITGLITAGGTYVESQRDRVVGDELRLHGERLAAAVADADRLAAAAGAGGDVAVRIDLPDRVAGGGYVVAVEQDGTTPDGRYRSLLLFRATNDDTSLAVPVATRAEVATLDPVPGGTLVVRLDGAGTLRVTRAETIAAASDLAGAGASAVGVPASAPRAPGGI
ncbi:DUF7266 family protein [Halobaculum lipolyticum]|uniref:Uncharacterized protein n=1 Tax=Halobaculum lipolyticum TaxID=3032001 RepID=A0ABD5W4T2_9EURY|nr:hypothetical protein [Halobaculum sp. DT31]